MDVGELGQRLREARQKTGIPVEEQVKASVHKALEIAEQKRKQKRRDLIKGILLRRPAGMNGFFRGRFRRARRSMIFTMNMWIIGTPAMSYIWI